MASEHDDFVRRAAEQGITVVYDESVPVGTVLVFPPLAAMSIDCVIEGTRCADCVYEAEGDREKARPAWGVCPSCKEPLCEEHMSEHRNPSDGSLCCAQAHMR